MKTNFKYFLPAIAAGFLLSANSVYATEVTANVTDKYRSVTKRIPATRTVCETVEVPVYGQSDSTTDGTILGGIVGGLLGNQVGKGNGKTAATAIGAVIGSQVGQNLDSQQGNNVVGYRREQQCKDTTTYDTISESVYTNSVVQFYYNGRMYSVTFKK